MADTTFGPKGWTPERLSDQSGKTYIITGANAGAGFQAARILLKKNAKVVMLNRSVEKSEAAIAAPETGIRCESRRELHPHGPVRPGQRARGCRRSSEERCSRIDALINNAAIAQVPTRKLTVDGFESQLGTNHYGHFLLNGLAL